MYIGFILEILIFSALHFTKIYMIKKEFVSPKALNVNQEMVYRTKLQKSETLLSTLWDNLPNISNQIL